MARRFAKVLEEEIEEAFFYPSDLVNTTAVFISCLGIYPPLFTSPSGDSQSYVILGPQRVHLNKINYKFVVPEIGIRERYVQDCTE